ncbi:hypothetical protein Tco_0823887 [Tanacetum coccineum]|uniref:Uncharacterized protein n=1 Tax=Tanacetum coccineum TaxID=301880 RepID=A0ABQ5ANK7_9ASTR
MILMVERNRGEHLIRRFAGRGNKPDQHDVKIASLKQGLRSCSAVKQDSLAEGRKLSPRNQIETYYLDIGDEKRRILLLINIQVFKKNNRVSGRGIDSLAKEAETESNIWDDGSEDVNPFGGGNHGFHDDHHDNPLLTKETKSEPIIWDIGDEEEEYPFKKNRFRFRILILKMSLRRKKDLLGNEDLVEKKTT